MRDLFDQLADLTWRQFLTDVTLAALGGFGGAWSVLLLVD